MSDRIRCAKGHEIRPDDVRDSNGQILPCGCPVSSPEGRRAEGLPPNDPTQKIA